MCLGQLNAESQEALPVVDAPDSCALEETQGRAAFEAAWGVTVSINTAGCRDCCRACLTMRWPVLGAPSQGTAG